MGSKPAALRPEQLEKTQKRRAITDRKRFEDVAVGVWDCSTQTDLRRRAGDRGCSTSIDRSSSMPRCPLGPAAMGARICARSRERDKTTTAPGPNQVLAPGCSGLVDQLDALAEAYARLSKKKWNESASASQLASITFSLTPTVPHTRWPSVLSIDTRTRAAVPSWALITRTL